MKNFSLLKFVQETPLVAERDAYLRQLLPLTNSKGLPESENNKQKIVLSLDASSL